MNELEPIVFIDNDVLPVRRSTERLIQSAGLKVQSFTSAKEFLKNARFEGPACLVLDVRMPGLSGMDLWTEICLTFPVLSALAEGYEVYIVTDASGGATPEAHDRAIQRMIQSGAKPLTVIAYVSELQRDWGREATVPQVIDIFERHAGGFGQGLRWEWQLLALKEGTR